MPSLRTLASTWTDSDCKACRTYGWLAILLVAAIIVPPIVVDIVLTLTGNTVMGVGALHGILIDYEDRVPAAPSLGKYRATFLVMLAGLLLTASICALFGVTMLRWANKARDNPDRSAQIRRKCRLLLLHLMLLPIWALLLGIVLTVIGIRQLLGYYLGSLIVLYLMEWLFIIPHVLAVIFLWILGLALGSAKLESNREAGATR